MRSLPHDRTEAARRTCRCLPCGNRDEPVTRDNYHAVVFRHRHNFRDAENFRLTSMPSDKWVQAPPGASLQPEAIVERAIGFAGGADTEVIGPSAQRAVQQRRVWSSSAVW
jgi:hypothetical protein